MASKSIIDRVLFLAAAVCAAGLIWQLTVLLTSKGKMPVARGVDMASSAAAATGSPAPAPPPAKPDAVAPQGKPAAAIAATDPTPVRVVYPDADTPKTTAKITDPIPPAPSSTPTASSAPAPASPDPSANALPTTGVIPVAMMSPISKAPAPAAPASSPPSDQVASAEPAADPQPAAQQQPAADPGPAVAASQTLNINNASIESLNRLRGGGHIGQAIAKHRPYTSVEDLVKKRVLRRDVFERIRSQIAAE